MMSRNLGTNQDTSVFPCTVKKFPTNMKLVAKCSSIWSGKDGKKIAQNVPFPLEQQ